MYYVVKLFLFCVLEVEHENWCSPCSPSWFPATQAVPWSLMKEEVEEWLIITSLFHCVFSDGQKGVWRGLCWTWVPKTRPAKEVSLTLRSSYGQGMYSSWSRTRCNYWHCLEQLCQIWHAQWNLWVKLTTMCSILVKPCESRLCLTKPLFRILSLIAMMGSLWYKPVWFPRTKVSQAKFCGERNFTWLSICMWTRR